MGDARKRARREAVESCSAPVDDVDGGVEDEIESECCCCCCTWRKRGWRRSEDPSMPVPVPVPPGTAVGFPVDSPIMAWLC